MGSSRSRFLVLIFVLIHAVNLYGYGAESPDQPKEKVLTGYPHIQIDLEKKELRLEAHTSKELNWGAPAIEFPLMSTQEKAYETLFITKADPLHINLGLILLGMRPAPIPDEILAMKKKPEKYPDNMPPLLTIDVQWEENGKTKQQDIRYFMLSRHTDEPPAEMLFAFTGSSFIRDDEGKNILVASQTGEVISLIYNSNALLNLSYNEPSPYADGGFGYKTEINALPPFFRRNKKMEIHGEGVVNRQIIREIPVTLIFKQAKR